MNPKKRQPLESHVDGCNVCRLLLVALAKTVTLGEDTIPPAPRLSAPR